MKRTKRLGEVGSRIHYTRIIHTIQKPVSLAEGKDKKKTVDMKHTKCLGEVGSRIYYTHIIYIETVANYTMNS